MSSEIPSKIDPSLRSDAAVARLLSHFLASPPAHPGSVRARAKRVDRAVAVTRRRIDGRWVEVSRI